MSPLGIGSRPTSGCFLSPVPLEGRVADTMRGHHETDSLAMPVSNMVEGRGPRGPVTRPLRALLSRARRETPRSFSLAKVSRGSSPRLKAGVSATRRFDDGEPEIHKAEVPRSRPHLHPCQEVVPRRSSRIPARVQRSGADHRALERGEGSLSLFEGPVRVGRLPPPDIRIVPESKTYGRN